MIAAGMGYPRGLLQLLVVLMFTAVGTQAECNQQETVQMISCVSPYMGRLLPLAGASCDKELISQDLCKDFKEIVDCVTRNNISSTCLEVGVSKQLQQFGFGCAVSDFQEKCLNTSTIQTGDFVHSTKPTPEGQTRNAGVAAVTRDYLSLLPVVTILVVFIYI